MADSMPERAASSTAFGVAVLRAAHQIIDGPPPILDDSVVGRLLGPEIEQRIRGESEQLQTPMARGLRSHVVLRSRFAEDSLAAAVARGTRQYLLLGAGLDTFAYRQPAWARDITIVEVDQPANQAQKRAMLAAATVPVPPNVRYADIDFERESLADGLTRHGVDMSIPTFFSWLGVTMYLQRNAIVGVLRTVASFPHGLEIVLTFAQPAEEGDGVATFADRAAAAGEPWVSYFRPREIEELLLENGFAAVRFLTRTDAIARYYAVRPDGLQPPSRVSIALATV
jgi:methyltransferase (TIGR00027 family)